MAGGGAKSIAKYISSYHELELLEISGCRIEKESMIALLESLKPSAEHGNLIHIDINDN